MKLIFLVITLMATTLYGQNKVSKFTINGQLADLVNGTTITLYHPSSQEPVATTTAQNKKFTLTGTVNFDGLGRLNIVKNKINTGIDLFFGNENISISGTVAKIADVKFIGGNNQKVFLKFGKVFQPEFNTLSKLNAEANTKVNDFEATQRIKAEFDAKAIVIGTKIDQFVKENASSPVSAFALYTTKDLFKKDFTNTKNNIALLKSNAATSIYTTTLLQEIEESMFGAEGSTALEFSQTDTAGKVVKLSDFKGKYVLLDFWASWCGPCRMENPNVVAAFQKFKSKNFTVVGISLDKSEQKSRWISAIAEDNLTWTHLSDLKFWKNEVAMLYKISSIPQNFLIDPNGKIVGKNLRGQALDEKLCQLLGCN